MKKKMADDFKGMCIRSDTFGKFKKIVKGTVFGNPYTFVTEYVQNCQRARAKTVQISITDHSWTIVDDGCGCDPQDFLTMDYSSWDSTKEGFGIGGWSGLTVDDLTLFTIMSKSWKAVLDIKHILDTEDLDVNIEEIPKMKGFKLSLESPWFGEHLDELEDEARKAVRYMPFTTYINGIEAERNTILDDFVPENGFTYTINHHGYKAKFSPVNGYSDDVKVYYDGRIINTPWWMTGKVAGVVSVDAGFVTMKEPDRTEMVQDSLYRNFREMIKKDIKKTYLAWIRENGVEDESYAQNISYVLFVDDYEKYLKLDPSLFPVKITKNTEEFQDEDGENDSESVYTVAASIAAPVNAERFSEPDFHQKYNPVTITTVRRKKAAIEKGNFREGIRKLQKKSFYVKACETEEYKDAMAEADYAGLNVLIAKNTLYENAFLKRKIPYISELQDAMVKTMERKESRLKTKKEEIFIGMLDPIVKLYSLREDTFRISNLSEVTEVWLHDQRVYRRIVKNRPNDIRIFGETDGTNIFLDRMALNLKRYHIKEGKMGIWEYKAFMNALPTIAHELAHYLYHTTDNTVEHFQAIEKITREITALY